MNGDGDIVIEDASGELTEIQKAEIIEGIKWVRTWLERRQKGGSFLDFNALGFDINEASEYKEAINQAKNLKVIVTNDLYKSLENALSSDRFRLREEVIREFGSKEDALFALAFVNEGKKRDVSRADIFGLNASNYIEEPVIFLDVKKFEEKKKGGYTPSLSSVVVQEVTHTLNLNLNESTTKEVFKDYLREGVVFDPYLDSEKEIYEHIMQLRKYFNLDPNKIYEMNDVAHLRQKARKEGQNQGYLLFDRYEDFQIMNWLNYTSQTKTDAYTQENNTYENSGYNDIRGVMKGGFVTLNPRVKEYFNSPSFKKAISFVRRGGHEAVKVTSKVVHIIKDRCLH